MSGNIEERIAAALIKHNVTCFPADVEGIDGFLYRLYNPDAAENLFDEPDAQEFMLGYTVFNPDTGATMPISKEVETRMLKLPGFNEDVVEPIMELLKRTEGQYKENPRWEVVFDASRTVGARHGY